MDTVGGLAERLYSALEGDDIAPILELCATDVAVEYPAAGRLAGRAFFDTAAAIDAHA